MPHFAFKNSAAALAMIGMIGMGSTAFSAAAHADNPPAKPRPVAHANPEVDRLNQAAIQAIRQGNIPLATIQLKNALRLDPDNGTVRARLGLVLLEGGDAASAERELRQARLNGARDEDAIPPMVQALLSRGKYSDVLADFPDPAPNDKSRLALAVLRARADSYAATNNIPAALSSLDRALAIQRDAGGLLDRARILLSQGQADPAMNYINQALQLAPGNTTGLLMKAAILRAKDPNAALAMLDGIIKTHPDSINAQVAKIELLLELKKIEPAQQAVDAFVARGPNLPIAQFYKGMLLGLHNKALDGWRIVQALPGDFIQTNERIVIGASQLAINAGANESANSMLTTYVGQHQDALEARTRLAALRLKMNNPAYALEILQPAMNTTNPKVLLLIAYVYEKMGQPAAALDYMRKANAAGGGDRVLAGRVALADLSQKENSRGMQEVLDIFKKNPAEPAALVAGVQLLAQQRKYDDANSLIAQAEKIAPQSPATPLLKGQILFIQGKADAALALFNQSLQRNPKYAPAMLSRAQYAFVHNKYDDANKDLKAAQALEPKNPLVYVKLAEVAAAQKQPAQSLALLKQGVAAAPNVVASRMVLAKYQITLRQFPDALNTLKDALKIAPNDGSVLAQIGQVQQAMGQKAAALGTNKALTQKYQQSGAAQALLANSMLANGDKKGAAEALKHAIKLSPDVRPYFVTLIQIQIGMGDKAGAVQTAQTWQASHVGPDGALLLADTYMGTGRLAEAATVIHKAQAVRPDFQLTVLDSRLANMQGKPAQALSILKNWLADHTTDLVVRQAYGDTLLYAKDDAGALAQYEIFLKARSDIPDVLNNTAWLLRDKDPARALALASKASEIQPGSPDIADTLGWLKLQKKDAQGALPILLRAHNLGPDNSQISYHLAMAYAQVGRKPEAKLLLQTALAKNANFPDAADAKKLLQTL